MLVISFRRLIFLLSPASSVLVSPPNGAVCDSVVVVMVVLALEKGMMAGAVLPEVGGLCDLFSRSYQSGSSTAFLDFIKEEEDGGGGGGAGNM